MPRISLTLKNALVYFLLLVLSLMILGYSIYRISSNKILENTTISLKHTNETVVYQFHNFLEDLKKDVQFLSKNPFIHNFISTQNNEILKENIKQEFVALLESNPNYSQIRLIGLDNKGKEVIRVDRFKDHLGPVAEHQLQLKGNRDYFRETIQLKKDSIYFSEINLNQEFGQIIFPMVPTLRVASPLFLGASIYGIVIINVNLNDLFSVLAKSAGNNGKLMLFNQDGFYLIHSDTNRLFRFEFNEAPSLNISKFSTELLPLASSHPMMKNYIHKSELQSVIEYNYPRNNYKLYFNLASDQNALLDVFNNWKKNIVLLTLFLTLISLALALYWTQRQSKQFKAITNSIIQFGKNPDKIQLNIHRDDEIGDLADSFIEMSDKVNAYVRDLKIAKTEADEANKAKQEFLETMSHEIRNPLQSIMGMVEVLDQNKPRLDQQHFIDSLKFSSEHLHTLVSDILDYRKLLRGQLRLNPKRVLFKDLIENILKSHAFEARKNRIKIRLELDHNLNAKIVSMDPVRFSQIINNLLSNGLRCSPENSELILNITTRGHNEICVKIKDQGPGITQENINNILLQKPLTGKAGQHLNYGLGLPIVLNLLKLFNTELSIESDIPGGSTFAFRINVEMGDESEADLVQVNNKINASQLIEQVVCIDDDVQNLFFYEQVLNNMGISPINYSGPSDLSLLKDHAVDLLISDVHFSESIIEDHFELISQKLKEDGNFILISASDTNHQTQEFLLGINGHYLQKPVSAGKLEELIITLVQHQKLDRPDYSDLYEQYDSNLLKIRTALELLLKEWRDMKGLLLHSIIKRDLNNFDQIVHKLINSLRNLKLNKFQLQLEQTRISIIETAQDVEVNPSKIELYVDEYLQLFEKKLSELEDQEFLS